MICSRSRATGGEERRGRAITARSCAQRQGRALPRRAPGTARRTFIGTTERRRGSGEAQGRGPAGFFGTGLAGPGAERGQQMLVGHKGVGCRRQHCGGDGEEQSLDHPSAGFVPVRPSDRVVGVGEDPGGQPESGFPSGGESV